MLNEAQRSEASMSGFLCKNGKVNLCAIRLIRVFRVLLLYGFLASLGMTRKSARHDKKECAELHQMSC